MDTTTLIWVIVAIVVVLAIVGILLAIGTKRRRRLAEEQKEQERRQAAKLRDEGKGAALDARERQVAADRQAADAEQAAVEAERLKLEAERQRAQAATEASASQAKLHEADMLDPDVNAAQSGRQERPVRGSGEHDPVDGEQPHEEHVREGQVPQEQAQEQPREGRVVQGQAQEDRVPQDPVDVDPSASHAPAHRRTVEDS